jgi:hypothetical protein
LRHFGSSEPAFSRSLQRSTPFLGTPFFGATSLLYLEMEIGQRVVCLTTLCQLHRLFTIKCDQRKMVKFFLICIVGGGIKVHSTLRPLNGLLCKPRVIMITEKSVE